MRPLHARGWERLRATPAARRWAEAALAEARAVIDDPGHAAEWRHGSTWFAGVDLLPNAPDGSIGGQSLMDAVSDDLADMGLSASPLHRAQLSVVRPGYPGRDPGETDAAARFRRDRDAAHLDGLLPVGPGRRRMLKEPHAFVLGLPLNRCSAQASPLVVWEGSHEVMRAAFRQAFADMPPQRWTEVDVTEAYATARSEVFRRCRRVPVRVSPGEAYVLHRLAIHGVAPWGDGAHAPPIGRVIAYFRPLLSSTRDWLQAP